MIGALKSSEQKTIGLLLVGGIHHILHLVPIASELEKDDRASVIVFVTNFAEQQACETVLEALGATRTQVVILEIGRVRKCISPKLAVLLSHLKIWTDLDALIVAERTSTILRFFSKRLPSFIHIPHGAGDRAKSYDPRIKHYDYVLVAGEKDKRRMIELDLVNDATCYVTGYIKSFAVKRMFSVKPKVFETDLPTVLYNPHFTKALSSWPEFGLELLSAFAKRTDMNFIFAPHIRLFSKQSEVGRVDVLAFDKFDNIHIDLGSERSTDMTYTRAADIYLGDVSSQVYEFLSEPKPCVFITKSDTQWENNPDYAHWAYGPVCHSVADVMEALDRAMLDLPEYAQVQVEGCRAATGDPSWDPISRASEAVKLILGL